MNASPLNAIYFIVYIILASFFVMNVFIAYVVQSRLPSMETLPL